MISSSITPKMAFHLEALLHVFSQPLEDIVIHSPRRLPAPLTRSRNTLTLAVLLECLGDDLDFVGANRIAEHAEFKEAFDLWRAVVDTLRLELPQFADAGRLMLGLKGRRAGVDVEYWRVIRFHTQRLAACYEQLVQKPIQAVDPASYLQVFYVRLDQDHPMCRFVKAVPHEEQRRLAQERLKARLRGTGA